jgi:hypothetical protein
LAGFHEVVVTPETLKTIEKRREEGRSLWRISSTLFSHIASDVILQPLAHFADAPGAAAEYPPKPAGVQVADELAAINLGAGSDGSSAAF